MKKASFLLLLIAVTLLCCIPSGAELFNASGLSNITIGGKYNFQVGIAFRATQNAPLGAIRFYMINQGTGYAGGTGGRFRYELYADNDGKPGKPLALAFPSSDPQYTQWTHKGGFPLLFFPSAPVLTKGDWYHFVLTNIDSEPTVNYSSADFLVSISKSNPDSYSYVEYHPAGDGWRVNQELIASPVGVFYVDGNSWGNGGYQVVDGDTWCGNQYGFLQSMCWQ